MNSVRLSHTSTGSGPAILLAGSLGSTRAMWDAQVQTLSASARIVAFDHRGHGDSPVPAGPYDIDDLGMDTLRLADELELDQFSFVGLSLGGMVGMWLGINAPDRLDRLVLMCTSAHMDSPAPWLDRARTARGDGVAPIAESVVSRWFTPEFADAHPDVIATYVEMVGSTPAEGYAGCCEAIAAMDLRADLAIIDTPTLVIGAAKDPSTPVDTAVAPIAAAIPTSQLVVVEDAAHLVNVQQPARVSGLLTEFLL